MYYLKEKTKNKRVVTYKPQLLFLEPLKRR